jgi:hypothetical protein
MMVDLPDPPSAPAAEKRPAGGVNYDLDAIRAAIRSGQIPKEVLTEVLGEEKPNG